MMSGQSNNTTPSAYGPPVSINGSAATGVNSTGKGYGPPPSSRGGSSRTGGTSRTGGSNYGPPATTAVGASAAGSSQYGPPASSQGATNSEFSLGPPGNAGRKVYGQRGRGKGQGGGESSFMPPNSAYSGTTDSSAGPPGQGLSQFSSAGPPGYANMSGAGGNGGLNYGGPRGDANPFAKGKGKFGPPPPSTVGGDSQFITYGPNGTEYEVGPNGTMYTSGGGEYFPMPSMTPTEMAYDE